MQRNYIYFFIAAMVLLGITAILVVSSLIIKRPEIISGGPTPTPTATETSPAGNFPALTDDWTLPVFTATPGETPANLPTPSASPSMVDDQIATGTAVTTPTQTALPGGNTGFCGASGSVTLIGLSLDDSGGQPPAVVMFRYFHFSFDQQTITVFSIPSSLVLSGKTISSLNLSEPTVNDLFRYTLDNLIQEEPSPETVGANLLARVVFEQFSIVPDQLFILETKGVMRLLNGLGELSLTLDGGETLALNPQQALDLMQTGAEGETKLQTQDRVLLSVFEKLNDPSLTPKILSLITVFDENAVSDISKDTLLQLACAITNVHPAEIVFLQLVPPYTSHNTGKDRVVDTAEVRTWVQEYFTK